MDCPDYNTAEPERKAGQHLQREDRGTIQHLHRLGYSNRAIARELHCSPTTVGNELRRGTPSRKSNRGRAPGYSARLGQAIYRSNRGRCHKPHKVASRTPFVRWVAQQVREHRWSLDACVGYARLQRLFKETEMVCTKTLYNELWAGRLPLSLFEVPNALKRRRTKAKNHINKRPKGRSIEERPAEVANRVVPGHWEALACERARKRWCSRWWNGSRTTILLSGFRAEPALRCRLLCWIFAPSLASDLAVSLRPSRPITARSLRTIQRLSSGEQGCSSHIRIPHGSAQSMSATTACSGPSFQRVPPLRNILRSRCWPLPMK